MEPQLQNDKFLIEDIRLLLAMHSIIEERLSADCYKQDFTISHILTKVNKDLSSCCEMISLRLMGDAHE